MAWTLFVDEMNTTNFHWYIANAVGDTRRSHDPCATAEAYAVAVTQYLRAELHGDETLRVLTNSIIDFSGYPELCACCCIKEFETRLERSLGSSIVTFGGCINSDFYVGAPSQHCSVCACLKTHAFGQAAPAPSPCLSPPTIGLCYAGIASRSPSPCPSSSPDIYRPESPLNIVITLPDSPRAVPVDVCPDANRNVSLLEFYPTPWPPPVVQSAVDNLIPELRAVSLVDAAPLQDGAPVSRLPSPWPLYADPYGLPPPLNERNSPYFFISGKYIKVKLLDPATRTYLPIEEAGNALLYDGVMYTTRKADDGAGETTFLWEELAVGPDAPAPSPAQSACLPLSSDSEPSLASSDAGSDSDSSALSLRTRSALIAPICSPLPLPPRARARGHHGLPRAPPPAFLPPLSPVMPGSSWLEPDATFAATRKIGDASLYLDGSSCSEGEDSDSGVSARYRRPRRSSSPSRHNPISRDRRRAIPSARQ
ncbi:hypothetical protein AURDEDRAFT_147060 [Auricularia subglabra TFB-10046 SS5]|uniref:Uncharacterized protein n=1 Tax=Auricularia subglabra (strain TFB-10046 / SS5) TaxID=717982 RepID=J0WUC0_AURST|nr:hypothetical protein AURDEDRAFT_147060 [Auricularia subglabra TFB-10046 SS5]